MSANRKSFLSNQPSSEHEPFLCRIEEQLKTKGVDAAARREILTELSSHFQERVAELTAQGAPNAMQQVEESLGDPSALAAEFAAVAQLRSARSSYHPTRLLAAGWTMARTFGQGLGVFAAGLIGYSIAGAGLVVAVLKLVSPQRVGFWVGDHGVVWGLMPPGSDALELAGRWFIPLSIWIAFLAGSAATLLIRKQLRSFHFGKLAAS